MGVVKITGECFALCEIPWPEALAEQIDKHLASTVAASDNEPELLARFNDIARELQTLINQPGWSSDDNTQLSARLQTILTDLTTPTRPAIDDNNAAATKSQLFAILDEELGT